MMISRYIPTIYIKRDNNFSFYTNETRTTKPGDTFFLPEGVYHLVESSGLGGTIMVTSVTDKPQNKKTFMNYGLHNMRDVKIINFI